MPKTVIIGSRPDCDLVIDRPSVSGRHCCVTRDESGTLIEDLNSTNGTFLNGQRVVGSLRVSLAPGDSLHLGSHAMPAAQVLELLEPAPGSVPSLRFEGSELVIGRVEGCGHVLDLPMISSRHARLFRSGQQVFLEDLKSSNGTFLNGVRLVSPVEVKQGDVLGLGSYAFTLDRDSWPPSPRPDEAQPLTVTTITSEESETEGPLWKPGEDARSGLAGSLGGRWPLAVMLLQAPLVALLIVGLLGQGSPAPTLLWLGLAVIWFGLSDAVLGGLMSGPWTASVPGVSDIPSLAYRCLALVLLCVLQCSLAWGIVAGAAGLKSPWLLTLAFLILSSLVGLALGLLIVTLASRPVVAWLILPVVIFLLWLLSGQWLSLGAMPPLGTVAASASPSRWTFEGLLLLESRETAGVDLAEPYFPVESQLMGLRADTMALVFLLAGLAATTAFIAASLRRAP